MKENGEIRWAIVTRMPSTGQVVNWCERSGTRDEFEACRERWADTDSVRVSPISDKEDEE